MKENYTQQLEETLNSLDYMKRAEAPPFFHSKLMNRIYSNPDFKPRSGFSFPELRLGYLVGILGFILLLNTFFLVNHFSSNSLKSEKSNLESFSEEFSLKPGNY